MNIKEILDLKIGGQWLVSPAANETILCRESFSQEHKDIEKMVLKFIRLQGLSLKNLFTMKILSPCKDLPLKVTPFQ